MLSVTGRAARPDGRNTDLKKIDDRLQRPSFARGLRGLGHDAQRPLSCCAIGGVPPYGHRSCPARQRLAVSFIGNLGAVNRDGRALMMVRVIMLPQAARVRCSGPSYEYDYCCNGHGSHHGYLAAEERLSPFRYRPEGKLGTRRTRTYTNSFIVTSPGEPKSRKHCARSEDQEITNWQPGHALLGFRKNSRPMGERLADRRYDWEPS